MRLAMDSDRSGLPKPEIVPSMLKLSGLIKVCLDQTKAVGPDGLNLTTLIIDTTFPKHASWHIFFWRLSILSLSLLMLRPFFIASLAHTDRFPSISRRSITKSINDYLYHPLLIFIWNVQFHGSSSPRNRRMTGRYLQRIFAAMLCGFGYRVSLNIKALRVLNKSGFGFESKK
jgi:hypothetical protein